MIEWMQKHKKWLVITIWISTLAFIGAGGFAWGMYDYSLSGDSVAKVGQIKISKMEFAQSYQDEFERQKRRFGDMLDEAQAKAMGLDERVLQNLISNALIRNYALDLGLRVSDEEIAREISTSAEFDFLKTDGVFDLAKYDSFIESQGLKKQVFEEQVRNMILTRKVIGLVFPQVANGMPLFNSALEKEALSFGFDISDTIELSVIYGSSIHVDADEAGLKAFWEARKDAYKTPASYKVEAIITKSSEQKYDESELQKFYEKNYIVGENPAIPESIKPQVALALQQQNAKIEALKSYSELQKSKAANTQELTIIADSGEYSEEIIKALESSAKGAAIKPLAFGDDFITLKVLEKNAPQIMGFDEVRGVLTQEYLKDKRAQELEKMAIGRLGVFKGERIAGIKIPTQEQISSQRYRIGNLDFYTSMGLLQKIFDSPKGANYAIIGENAFLFRIISQAVDTNAGSSVSSGMADSMAAQVKIELMAQLVFEFLERQYKIQKFI
ncbi:hypothetical protein BKN38_09275 [Helicobacter sp. CLO-3]|uniref:peptidylprolyl isomerase n=1 Tax=unclassified Helicobacter TaxID=2593540 RepID=UPI000805D8EB|nr:MULTISPECIES: peptidylprolyl isomerase [unclassified Helicobacter]OBV29922.1 hypothetical protein BA723_03615 [Helicobacter sp. CLO-3]OHU81324.1 hypothetical protein BKN38_09275 [Helicobacter sp. CLO-3]